MQGGSGYAKDIVFQNMVMNSVKNPIIIDQNYCDSAKKCETQEVTKTSTLKNQSFI
jgi:polygalacturonase